MMGVCQPLFARFSADFVKVKKLADHAFMTLPLYIRTREGETLSWIVARNPAGWAFELGSAMSVPDREADENVIFTGEMPSRLMLVTLFKGSNIPS